MFEQAIRRYDLDGALAAAKDAVRAAPTDPERRLDLAHALILGEQWAAARSQLELVGQLDARRAETVASYLRHLSCEEARQEVFAGRQRPAIAAEPMEWLALQVESLRLLAAGAVDAALELRQQAFTAAPAAVGVVNGERFECIADADPRLGPVLELFQAGKYLWVPFAGIRAMEAREPAQLMDLVWLPVTITWSHQGVTQASVPVRYPSNGRQLDDALRFSCETRFIELGEDHFVANGTKLLCGEAGECSLLALRTAQFEA